MATPKEIDKELMERLYDLLVIQKANPNIKINELDKAISRAKASMTAEQIAWVEKLVNDLP